MKISHRGLFTGEGVPCSLATAIKGTAGSPGSYQYFDRLVQRTTVQGEVALGDGSKPVLGILIDVSPKGDSGTVETGGFVWVSSAAGLAVGDCVTPAASGKVAKIAGAVPTDAEHFHGVWEVDEVDMTTGAERVLINIEARL